MTETQAMSETAGNPTNPADADTKNAAAAAGAEPKPAEPKPAEARPVEAKVAEPKPVEAKPDEPKAVEPKPMNARSAEAKPVETKSAEPKPTEPAVAKGRASVPSVEVPQSAPPLSAPTFTRPAGMPAPSEDGKKKPGKGDKSTPPLGRTAMGAATLRSVVTSATAGAVRVTEAVRAARTSATVGASRGPRRARLTVKRVDPWSVMKFSFAVSFVLLVVIIVATSVLYLALDAMGVFDSVNKTLAELFTSNGGGEPFKITAAWVIGLSAILGAINVVLFTALMTLGAFVYNVCADLVGGVEVTLAERE
jgi:outer membrane biosynthesis protein TonB